MPFDTNPSAYPASASEAARAPAPTRCGGEAALSLSAHARRTSRARALLVLAGAAQVALLCHSFIDPASLVELLGPARGLLPVRTWSFALVVQLAALAASAFLWWRLGLVVGYRPVPSVGDDALPTVTVIVPAFNEGRQVLRTLRSLALSHYPAHKLQIVTVDDGSKDDTWHWMQCGADELGAWPGGFVAYRRPRNGGKRRALRDGAARATGEVLVTVDSDSEVLPDTLRNLVTPLVLDARVGAVAGNVRVLEPGASLIGRMMDVSFTSAFELGRAGESRVGMVMCCPGALSAFRASLIADAIDDWAEQQFWGRFANIGEDRALTNIVLARGARVVFQSNAIVLTKVPTRPRGLSRMLMRWYRSDFRESLELARFVFGRFREGSLAAPRALFVWSVIQLVVPAVLFVPTVAALVRYPMLVPWMLLAALIGAAVPALMFFAARGSWRAVWAFPWAVAWTLGLSWIPFYALLTVRESGWMTRGDDHGTARLARRPLSGLAPSEGRGGQRQVADGLSSSASVAVTGMS